MKLTQDMINESAARVEGFCNNLPTTGKQIVDSVLGMGSGDETVCILALDELEGNSTICGDNSKVHFTPNVIQFLKDWSVNGVVVGVIGPEAVQDTDDEIGLIAGGAVRVPNTDVNVLDWKQWFPNGNQYLEEKEADGDEIYPSQILSELISENHGSWRDDSCVYGWSSYESE